MPSFEEAVAQLRGPEAGGFGISEPQASKVLNQAIRQFASASEWIRAILDLGPAVADQERYLIPPNVVKIKRLRIAQSLPYSRQGIETLWDLQNGQARLAPGWGGIFVAEYDEDGTVRYVTLWPTPGAEEAGAQIPALASIFPAEDLESADQLPFPEDSTRGVFNAAKSILYEDVDENPEQASYYRDLANGEAEQLRRKANSRVGGGPVKFPVSGH